jgi:hypothetical protein
VARCDSPVPLRSDTPGCSVPVRYRFIAAAGSRSDEGERRGKKLTGGQLEFRRGRSISNCADDVGLPRAGGYDDEVC